jgi:hydroxyacylglutathione hydrolase
MGASWSDRESVAGAAVGPGTALSPATAVDLIPALSDNYVFVWHQQAGHAVPGQAVVVDPAVAPPVIDWLEQRHLELVAVLQTHHHSDHIGGTPELLRRWPATEVIAAAADRQRIAFQTHPVRGGDRFNLLGRPVEVLDVPGHTSAHVAYYLPPVPDGHGELFCGDTLFAGGCGRLFEGSAEQMHHSLQQLAALPDATRVWCAHEYTLANLRWAAALTAGANGRDDDGTAAHGAIAARLAAVERLRRAGGFTIPSSIAQERATNLFLMATSPAELALRRRHKDHWKG